MAKKKKARKLRTGVYSENEIHAFSELYLKQQLPIQVCAEKLGRPLQGLKHKLRDLGWAEVRKQMRGVPEALQRDVPDRGAPAALQKGEALVNDFIRESGARAANAMAKGFDLFETEGKKKKPDLFHMDTSLRIAERASNMARKAMGLDQKGAAGGGWDPYYQRNEVPKKVQPAEDDAIDV